MQGVGRRERPLRTVAAMTSAPTTSRALVLLGVAALAGVGLTACAPDAAPSANETASASASPSGSAPPDASTNPDATTDPAPTTDPAAQLDWPDTALPTQVGAALLNPPGSDPEISTGQSTAGPALFEANRTVRITADCVGSRMRFELRTAQVGEEQRLLVGEQIPCGTESSSSHSGIDYAGPVQLAITDANGVDAGWVQATLEP